MTAGRLASTLFESGGKQLLARVFVADGSGPHPTVLLLHGFPGTELNFDLAHDIRRRGWNVFLPHYRGSWGMPGTYSFANVVDDVASAVRYLRSPEYAQAFQGAAAPLVVIGHSLGGFAAIRVGAEDKAITAVGGLAAFNFGALAAQLSGDPAAVADIEDGWRDSVFALNLDSPRALIDEVLAQGSAWDLLHCASALGSRPTLLIAGAGDDVALPAVHHTPLVGRLETLNPDALTTMTLETDHGFTTARPAVCQAIAEWLEPIKSQQA